MSPRPFGESKLAPKLSRRIDQTVRHAGNIEWSNVDENTATDVFQLFRKCTKGQSDYCCGWSLG